MVAYQTLKDEMRVAGINQHRLYEKHVYAKIVANEDTDTISSGYQEYISSLKGFDIDAFDRVIHKVLHDEDEEVLDHFAEGFKSIPSYIIERNNWSERIKDVLDSNADNTSKQMQIDTMDRKRTSAHNGVINLFNDINQYADDNRMPKPYPTDYNVFMKENLEHRADVADILTRHTTLLESAQEHVWEKFTSTGKTSTRTDSLDEVFRTEGLGGLMREVSKLQSNEDSLADLSTFNQQGR